MARQATIIPRPSSITDSMTTLLGMLDLLLDQGEKETYTVV